MDSNKSTGRFSRRAILKTVGATGLFTTGFTGTAVSKSAPDREVIIKGDLSNPISFDEVSTKSQEFADEFEHDMAVPKPIDYGDAEVVAFLMFIKDDGVPSYYIGAVPKNTDEVEPRTQGATSSSSDVAARHNELDRRVAKLREKSSNQTGTISSTNTVSATASAGGFSPDSNWNRYSDGVIEVGACPYGKYHHTVDVWGHQDTYATGSKVAIFPGTNECSSGWLNNIQIIRHLWSEGDFEDAPTVEDFQPSGGADGQITGASLSVGYQSLGIGFSYKQPAVERDNNSTTTDAKWYYDWQRQHSDSTVLRTASIVTHDTGLEPYGHFLNTHTEHEFWVDSIPDGSHRFKNTEAWAMH